jgi:DnaK suppressor protein
MSKIHTEAQLLKLPASAYMDTDQLAFFAQRLKEMKQALLDNALDTSEHLRENETLADPNDRASMEEGNQLEQRVRDRERKLLKKIDAALARIDDGSFGFCQDSGEPIGLPRLLARPTAELSVESQERHERREKLHG